MKTITFYSYKGGTGRSLALANAARYLARLEFKVVALDFDLEAPGLHYKFSSDTAGNPLPVQAGVVDYLHSFIIEGTPPDSLKKYCLDVSVPGTDKPLVKLIPAGVGPSREYWSKLSRMNWHELFYSKGAQGVQVFLDLKNRIADELTPDFLLVDSRTGITEMGGVATTLLADKVISLVLPSRENLEGTRAVLRSLQRSRRESGAPKLEVVVALSRLPQTKDEGEEQQWTERIRTILNEEAQDLEDTLSCSEVFLLHSEEALEIRESLRVGSGVSSDDSVLLRDYLRLFASVVPKELIEPKVGKLIQQAREKIWDDPEAALKEVEELAESFGHPETYRALLRFYEVRNAGGTPVLKRAQRLWELTRDSADLTLWQVLRRTFKVKPRWQRSGDDWSPNLDFIEALWRDAGKMNPEFGGVLSEAYGQEDRESRAADVLLEVIQTSEPTAEIVARCIGFLDIAKRPRESADLIEQVKARLLTEPVFLEAWARHAIQSDDKDAVKALVQPPVKDVLVNVRPSVAAQVFSRAGLLEEAAAIGDKALLELAEQTPPYGSSRFEESARLFHELGRWEEFRKTMEGRVPSHFFEEMRERLGVPRRRGGYLRLNKPK